MLEEFGLNVAGASFFLSYPDVAQDNWVEEETLKTKLTTAILSPLLGAWACDSIHRWQVKGSLILAEFSASLFVNTAVRGCDGRYCSSHLGAMLRESWEEDTVSLLHMTQKTDRC